MLLSGTERHGTCIRHMTEFVTLSEPYNVDSFFHSYHDIFVVKVELYNGMIGRGRPYVHTDWKEMCQRHVSNNDIKARKTAIGTRREGCQLQFVFRMLCPNFICVLFYHILSGPKWHSRVKLRGGRNSFLLEDFPHACLLDTQTGTSSPCSLYRSHRRSSADIFIVVHLFSELLSKLLSKQNCHGFHLITVAHDSSPHLATRCCSFVYISNGLGIGSFVLFLLSRLLVQNCFCCSWSVHPFHHSSGHRVSLQAPHAVPFTFRGLISFHCLSKDTETAFCDSVSFMVAIPRSRNFTGWVVFKAYGCHTSDSWVECYGFLWDIWHGGWRYRSRSAFECRQFLFCETMSMITFLSSQRIWYEKVPLRSVYG